MTLTATYPLRQHEIEAGEVVNTATLDAIFTDPGTNAVTNVPGTSNTVVVPIDQLPELSFVKTASSAISTPAVVGETITYTFTVKNTGNVLIEGVTLADPLPGMTPAAFTLGDMAPAQSRRAPRPIRSPRMILMQVWSRTRPLQAVPSVQILSTSLRARAREHLARPSFRFRRIRRSNW
ncbi:DUF11 domain-containing protein [Gemmobacter sp. 24YEA27]|uniref:DUF11 domain-containing protein n=1 Tax=Gemmobacter sp. 24YEA27 TaxID=3040672 RepID=UPI0024B36254|nr:DUF11 domain-containing protein [Gemmobacter sp. 24YEA27]